jgi:glycosyltransferase involved in cell wall biosynthesis
MTSADGSGVALYFDADAYTESHARTGVPGGPAGLMGRQVAGKEFLDAYLSHAASDTLTAVVRAVDRGNLLVQICRDHPSSQQRPRRLVIVPEADFLPAIASPRPPASVLHIPCPPDAKYVWGRQGSGARFAISGVTHTLSSVSAVQSLCNLLTAPFESFDALVCTSRAVVDMVRAVTGTYADYLAERFGGRPQLRVRLETIPLGVNPDRFRPATPAERAAERARFGAADDEVMVLCVGRLSHHAKAHPFPVFHAADQAARRTGKKVFLVFAGWAAHPAVDKAYRDAAVKFAPAARVAFVDGQDPAVRVGAWRAADMFVSLPDNIQETFGLVCVEGMASGLPVLASDWDGYRDLIVNGETGYLVPTQMVQGATTQATTRLLFGQVNYDHFLAECSQAAIVDPEAAADALARLVADADLRHRMGQAGRVRAVEHFRWERVVRAYETLWADQAREVLAWSPSQPAYSGPAAYPAPEQTFAGYPTEWLVDADQVQANAGAAEVLPTFLMQPLTSVSAERRCRDAKAVADVLRLTAQARSIGDIAGEFERAGADPVQARATVAWLLKYGLLKIGGS